MFCFERSGSRIKGKVFGLLFLDHQLGAFLTVQLGAWSFDATRSYQHTVVALVGITLCSAACSWFGLRRAGALPVEATGRAVAASR
ncbi:hypothetical protein ACIP1U_23385 [Cupriavidus sp. NPDC089707]|uniref:hypothetical protein n=1 Tax=Cupriavidus sp. NPDC089707 TaxID=3363963 RepID=UPI0037F93822